MNVVLLYSPTHEEAVNILYAACRQCYYSGFIGNYEFLSDDFEKKEKLLKHVLASGHHSVLEHINFTFAIGRITRACAQQLTRHRIGVAFSMQSLRYCETEEGNLHIPTSINRDPDACSDYLQAADAAVGFYKEYINREHMPIAKEDAREILPMGWYTNLVMTMNCRELLHFFSERLCSNAQEEIRILAKKILQKCQEVLPEIFNSAGPKCQVVGYCNEGKRSCHKSPLKEEVFHIYNNHIHEEKITNLERSNSEKSGG